MLDAIAYKRCARGSSIALEAVIQKILLRSCFLVVLKVRTISLNASRIHEHKKRTSSSWESFIHIYWKMKEYIAWVFKPNW